MKKEEHAASESVPFVLFWEWIQIVSRDSRNQQTLIFPSIQHVSHSSISQSEDMRSVFLPPPTFIGSHDGISIDRQGMIRIDGDQEQTRIGLS